MRSDVGVWIAYAAGFALSGILFVTLTNLLRHRWSWKAVMLALAITFAASAAVVVVLGYWYAPTYPSLRPLIE
jgi:hypothetical protein